MSHESRRPITQPRIASDILAGVVGIEIDETPLDEPVANLEHIAPTYVSPFILKPSVAVPMACSILITPT
jgi:hypothetical protein